MDVVCVCVYKVASEILIVVFLYLKGWWMSGFPVTGILGDIGYLCLYYCCVYSKECQRFLHSGCVFEGKEDWHVAVGQRHVSFHPMPETRAATSPMPHFRSLPLGSPDANAPPATLAMEKAISTLLGRAALGRTNLLHGGMETLPPRPRRPTNTNTHTSTHSTNQYSFPTLPSTEDDTLP